MAFNDTPLGGPGKYYANHQRTPFIELSPVRSWNSTELSGNSGQSLPIRWDILTKRQAILCYSGDLSFGAYGAPQRTFSNSLLLFVALSTYVFLYVCVCVQLTTALLFVQTSLPCPTQPIHPLNSYRRWWWWWWRETEISENILLFFTFTPHSTTYYRSSVLPGGQHHP